MPRKFEEVTMARKRCQKPPGCIDFGRLVERTPWLGNLRWVWAHRREILNAVLAALRIADWIF